MNLYPLKFAPIVKDKIWGGHKLEKMFGKNPNGLPNIGESWELSGCAGDVSVISNGYLAGNTLEELIEVYMGDLVGDKVYERFGLTFPLLFKLIDANDDLSIQVHPNDEVAAQRHNSFGKTEMWYILDANKDASLIAGFTKDSNAEEYTQKLAAGQVETLLQKVPEAKDDAIFIHAGLVHAIGRGIVLAEIQQTSDITYRIYDYNRKDASGKTRQLHTAEALDVIDYSANKKPKIAYVSNMNHVVNLAKCQYFTTNVLEFDQTIERDYAPLDSFVAYMCVEGCIIIETDSDKTEVAMGETVLIPAVLNDVRLIPENGKAKLLEVYID